MLFPDPEQSESEEDQEEDDMLEEGVSRSFLTCSADAFNWLSPPQIKAACSTPQPSRDYHTCHHREGSVGHDAGLVIGLHTVSHAGRPGTPGEHLPRTEPRGILSYGFFR